MYEAIDQVVCERCGKVYVPPGEDEEAVVRDGEGYVKVCVGVKYYKKGEAEHFHYASICRACEIALAKLLAVQASRDDPAPA